MVLRHQNNRHSRKSWRKIPYGVLCPVRIVQNFALYDHDSKSRVLFLNYGTFDLHILSSYFLC